MMKSLKKEIKYASNSSENIYPRDYIYNYKAIAKKNEIKNNNMFIFHIFGKENTAIGIRYQMILACTGESIKKIIDSLRKKYDFKIIEIITLTELLVKEKEFKQILKKYTIASKEWNEKEIIEFIKSNSELFKEKIIEYYEVDYEITKENEGFSFKTDNETVKKYSIYNYETLINLGFDNLWNIFKQTNLKSLPSLKLSQKDEIEKRVSDFMIKSMENFYTVDSKYPKKDFKLKDKSDFYYVGDFGKKTESSTYMVFQLSKYPKAYANITGSEFHYKDKNSFELFRAILLSFIYFGTSELHDY